jgi:hypothetical protein
MFSWSWYPDENALFVKYSLSPFSYGVELDSSRFLEYDAENSLVGIEFLNIDRGIDLQDIPDDYKSKLISTFIRNSWPFSNRET